MIEQQQQAEADERQRHQRPGPRRLEDHGRQRDLHEVQEAERVVGAAGQVQEPGQRRDVERHDRGQHPPVGAPAPADRRRQRDVRAEPDRDHRPQQVQRQIDAEQHVGAEHRRRLPDDLRPAQLDEPLRVDRARVGDAGVAPGHGRTITQPRRRRAMVPSP
jgi:hypothetical protein